MRVEAEVANLGSRGIRSLAVAKTAAGSSLEVRWQGVLHALLPAPPPAPGRVQLPRLPPTPPGARRLA